MKLNPLFAHAIECPIPAVSLIYMLKKIVMLLALFVTVGIGALASADHHGYYRHGGYYRGPGVRYYRPHYRPYYRPYNGYGYYRPYYRPYYDPYYVPPPYPTVQPPGVTLRFGW